MASTDWQQVIRSAKTFKDIYKAFVSELNLIGGPGDPALVEVSDQADIYQDPARAAFEKYEAAVYIRKLLASPMVGANPNLDLLVDRKLVDEIIGETPIIGAIALEEIRKTGNRLRKSVVEPIIEKSKTEYRAIRKESYFKNGGKLDDPNAMYDKMRDVSIKNHETILNALCEKSPISQQQADDWVNSFVEIPANVRQKLKKIGYPVETLKKDMAVFYRFTCGRIPFVKFDVKRGNRSSALHSDGIIHIAGTMFNRMVLWHEMGHLLEKSEAMVNLSEAWLEARIKYPKQTKSLRSLTNNKGYRPDEIAYIDGFFDPYVGKKYRHRTTEVMSMGFQQLRNEEGILDILEGNPDKKQKADPDHLDLILGITQLPVSEKYQNAIDQTRSQFKQVNNERNDAKILYAAMDKAIQKIGVDTLLNHGQNRIDTTYGYRRKSTRYWLFLRQNGYLGLHTEFQYLDMKHARRALYVAMLLDQRPDYRISTEDFREIQFQIAKDQPLKGFSTDFSEWPALDPAKIK
ncbi:hypothetical protein [Desulfatirhabdium butyrativorans]|uniref:hypothetical protein n=1 Tax=Desulfatirhabdium butyrativorans TaxID=340467 RepID=UPI000421321D|nr:hypothetical protein [Desulfatirhabdium butyrativorans]